VLLLLVGGIARNSAPVVWSESSLSPCPQDQSQVFHNCFGTHVYPNGDKYVGEFRDGMSHGQGTYYSLADGEFKGDKYVGEFRDGMPNGRGTYSYADGDKYVGEWRDGKSHGQGTS
jgi:hypothetical protein